MSSIINWSKPWHWLRLPVLGIIWIYQHTISPDHGPLAKMFFPDGYCKFTPTCSEYGYEAVRKYGLMRGVPKMLWRIVRCNPWSRGGVDVP